jgi:hypothetical protein
MLRASLGVGFLLLIPALATAAPEDRGLRGWYVGGGGGVVIGQASDAEGRDPGGFLGAGGRFRVGDEVVPNLGIGLAFLGAGGTGNNASYESGFGGFLLDITWRPLPTDLAGLVISGGVGVGGGTITPKDDALNYEGTPGGTLYGAGITWEIDFGDDIDGFVFAPGIQALFVPAQAGNEAGMSAFMVALETVWYAGR